MSKASIKNAARTLSTVAAMTLALCGGAAQAQAQTVKIGVIGALTGPGASWGLAVAEGTRIAAEEHNARGGLDVGGKKVKVEVIAYDDQYKTPEAVAAYNRLVNQDGVKYVVLMTTAATMALKTRVEEDKVLALTASFGSKTLDKNTKYMFKLYSTPDQYTDSFVEWIKKNQIGRRVVTINPNDEVGWDLTQLSERAFKDKGFEVVGKELFERTQKDFQPMLTKIVALKPDIIELGGTPPATAGLIVRQARELGYEKLFTKVGGTGPREIVAAAGAKAAEGTINLLYADPKNEGWRRLAAAYKKNRGHDGNEIMVSFYDSTQVLLSAMQKAGTTTDTAAVAAAFGKALPMKSLQGDELRLDGMKYYGVNNQFITTHYIGAIRNGETEVIGKIQ
jgi:branched-chain amino acid transport system substrate-binding protein